GPMEGIRFIDIYATKGLEYLIVIAFLAAFVVFARHLSRPRQVAAGVAPAGDATRFRVPEGFFYHQGHSWLRPEQGSIGVVGLDDFAQKLVGKVDSLRLPAVGTSLTQGGKGWSLMIDSIPISMLSPVDGEVVEVNRAVERWPELLKEDPYGKGWLLKVRSPRMLADTHNLLSGKVARAWMENALDRLQPLSSENAGPALADGGLPVEGLARILGGTRWQDLARTHLLSEEA
ncbi:MAG TPA: glycine cleavage system protein H, partial [Anaeromyxobacteraceae bacterium]|nr:glycine cleavage system protein H [Anaeromyxobacteraceae bacterium]